MTVGLPLATRAKLTWRQEMTPFTGWVHSGSDRSWEGTRHMFEGGKPCMLVKPSEKAWDEGLVAFMVRICRMFEVRNGVGAILRDGKAAAEDRTFLVGVQTFRLVFSQHLPAGMVWCKGKALQKVSMTACRQSIPNSQRP